MEKKTISSTSVTSAPLDLNLPPAENTELVKGSCNLENLVTHSRMHDDVSAEGDLQHNRSTTGLPSYQDFTGDSPGETCSNQFHQSGQRTNDGFLPINTGVAAVDDGIMYGRYQLNSRQAMKIGRTYPTFTNANEPTGFEPCNKVEPVNCNKTHNPFQLASLPSYPGMVTRSGTVGGRFQFGNSHNLRFGSKDPDIRNNAHMQLRHDSQGDGRMMPNSLQLANLQSSQTSSTHNLFSDLAGGFQSSEGTRNFVTLNQPKRHHHHHPPYGGSVNFRNEDDATSMIQSGNEDRQIFNSQQDLHPIILGTSSDPHVAFLSNINSWNDYGYTGGGGSSHPNMLSGMPSGGFDPGENKNNKAPYTSPNLLMHVRRMNHMATSNITQNFPVYDQYPLQMMQSSGLYSHAASTGNVNNRHEAAVHSPAWHSGISGLSIPANAPHQLFFSPLQRSYQRNMRTSVANPFISQMHGHQGSYGQNMTPSGMNFVHTNFHSVDSQHAVNYSKGNIGVGRTGLLSPGKN